MEDKTRGAPLKLEGIKALKNNEVVSLDQFMLKITDTSPTILEAMTGIPKQKWWTWKKNWTENSMSIDKQLSIVKKLGCTYSPILVTINIQRHDAK